MFSSQDSSAHHYNSNVIQKSNTNEAKTQMKQSRCKLNYRKTFTKFALEKLVNRFPMKSNSPFKY